MLLSLPARIQRLCRTCTELALLILACCPQPSFAEKPVKLSQQRIEQLTQEGDRLADQGDYLNALRKYTEAYTGVVASIRGQDFLNPVKPDMLNREQLAQELLEQISKEFTEEDLALMDASYHALGLMSPEKDGKSLMTKLLTEEVAGFYDPDHKRMVLIVEDGPQEQPNWLGKLLGAKAAFDKDEQKTTLAHELTHALQDQLYDLNAMEGVIEDDDDMLLAFSALVEGDATLLMFAEAGGGDIQDMDPDAMRATFNMMSWMMPLAGGEAFREAPPIFRESLIFPYFQGMLFTLAVAGQEGWKSVHEAYRAPPMSSEQILHPAKYLDASQRDMPQRVTLPKLDAVLGKSWTPLGGNVLGELQTSIMLKGLPEATLASAGWDGDRYEIFRRDDGKLGLAFVSIWDSEQDAKEFAEAYSDFRDRDPQGSHSVFDQAATRVIDQQQNQVRILEGFESTLSEQILELLNECQFEDKSFEVPEPNVSTTTPA